MTVAIINPHYPPTICGVGDHTFHLIQSMLAAGIETHLICSKNQQPEPVEKPRIYPIIERWNRRGFKTVLNKLATIKPDWVLVQYVPHGYDPRGLPLAILRFYSALSCEKYQILTIFHEVCVRSGHRLSSSFISAVEKYIARQLTKQSTKIATSIDFYADILRGPQKNIDVHIVPIGSGITPVETPVDVKKALEIRYNISENANVIVTFGNRNIADYLDAFDCLATEFSNIVWLLCGKNSTATDLTDGRFYIRRTGELSPSTLYQSLSLGNIAFLPEPVNAQMQGGSSNKSTALATVFSLGIPVIGVKGDLNNALLRDKENILLPNLNDPDALYNALKYCLNTEGASEKLGRAAREFYETHLAWNVVGKQYLKLLNQL